MISLILIMLILFAGGIFLFIIALPTLRNAKQHSEHIVIPLTEIAPVWTRHNKEIIPLTSEEQESNRDSHDELEISYELRRPEKLQLSKDNGPALEQPASIPTNESRKAGTVAQPASATIISGQTDSLKEEGITEKTGLSLSSLAEPLKSLWDDCIVPYKEIIKSQGAEDVLMSILHLIEKHGHCPSVVIDSKDDESLDMITVRDNLVQVSLREHTYAVCRYMMGSLKNTFHDYEVMVSVVLVSALAHDIGKIPELRMSGAYNSKDHAKVGSFKLAELLEGSNTVWGKRAVRAVNDHHTSTKDAMTTLLKQADRQARQSELAACTRSYAIKTFSEWFNLKNYLTHHIAPGVNVSQTGKWNAFSFRGTIYARPDWLYEQARRMCHAEKILDLTFIYSSEKDNAIRMVVNAMRHENITPLLGENYPARKFDIRTSVAVKKLPAMYLTAFSIPDYLNMVEMESRKSGFTEIIDTVIPM